MCSSKSSSNTIEHCIARFFRVMMPEEIFDDTLLLFLSNQTGFFRVLHCSANTSSAFCGGGFRVCLLMSGCRRLQRTGSGHYLPDAVSAHTHCGTVPNNTDYLF